MTVKDLENLNDYGQWANKKLFVVLAQLTPEQFTQNVAGSYGSIRNTLVHAMSADWGWLDRCGGTSRGPKLEGADYPTLESIIAQWEKVEVYVRLFLSTLNDADLRRNVQYEIPQGKGSLPMGEILHHGAIHAIHHRGQVALLLRMLGYSPGNFDIGFYYAEKEAARSSAAG